jgi:hypothetical protein
LVSDFVFVIVISFLLGYDTFNYITLYDQPQPMCTHFLRACG